MAGSEQETNDRDVRIRRLLDELNEWERLAGLGHPPRPELKSTGESNARIESLKEELVALGARYRWVGEAYALEATAEPGQGAELPETAP